MNALAYFSVFVSGDGTERLRHCRHQNGGKPESVEDEGGDTNLKHRRKRKKWNLGNDESGVLHWREGEGSIPLTSSLS